jgi:hypothetical protein
MRKETVRMQHSTRFLVLALMAGGLSLLETGCKSDGDKAPAAGGVSDTTKSDHPKADHPKGDHPKPDHPK